MTSTRLLGAGLAVLLTAALSGTAQGVAALLPASAVATNRTYRVPAGGSVVVRGHGYGHGHGMSQYGAEGAALQGLDYRRIIDFYYPGTSWSTFSGTVRVLITGDTTSDVVVSPAAGLTVRDLGTGTTYPVPAISGVKRWRLNVDAATNRTVVGYRTTRWHRWRPGGHDALAGDGQLRAAGPLTLWTPSGARSYRGALRAASPYPGSASRDTVNVVSMDTYVKGVVPNEMPASWRKEAVRAQAVAARTYATWSRAQNPARYYQVCDTSSCQVYGGYRSEDPRSNAAVDATAGRILTYGGKAAFTQFGSSSGGWTADGGPPYLPAQKDPYDATSVNPVHSWSTTLHLRRLESSYPRLGTLRSVEVTSRDGHGQWRGRVRSMVLDGTSSNVTISGETFRSIYGLRSSWFSFDTTAILARRSRPGGGSLG